MERRTGAAIVPAGKTGTGEETARAQGEQAKAGEGRGSRLIRSANAIRLFGRWFVELFQKLVESNHILWMNVLKVPSDVVQMVSILAGQLHDVGLVAQSSGGEF